MSNRRNIKTKKTPPELRKRLKNERPKNNSQPPKPKIFIFCEGEKTEPNYFRGFQGKLKGYLLVVKGEGYNTLSLVELSIKKLIRDDGYDKSRDEVWIVFDKDSFDKDDFDNAIHKSLSKGFKVAWSNEAFELWYVLHFEFMQSALTRDDYKKKLNSPNYLTKYEKKDDNIYDKLVGRMGDAIRNAENLSNLYGDKTHAKANPKTTVHELVKFLNNFI